MTITMTVEEAAQVLASHYHNTLGHDVKVRIDGRSVPYDKLKAIKVVRDYLKSLGYEGSRCGEIANLDTHKRLVEIVAAEGFGAEEPS